MKDDDQPSGHERCGGTTRRGTPCRLPAGHGTGHPVVGRCSHHCGATPNGEANGRRLLAERAEEEARGELARLGYAGAVVNPIRKLAELAAEADELKRLLARKVDELAELTGEGGGPGAWFAAFERAFDRVAAMCAMLGRLDIDDRLLQMEIRQAEGIGGREAWRVAGMLDDLHLSPEQEDLVPVVVPKWFRADPPDWAATDNWQWKPRRGGAP
jgi:hypothetical protein